MHSIWDYIAYGALILVNIGIAVAALVGVLIYIKNCIVKLITKKAKASKVSVHGNKSINMKN